MTQPDSGNHSSLTLLLSEINRHLDRTAGFIGPDELGSAIEGVSWTPIPEWGRLSDGQIINLAGLSLQSETFDVVTDQSFMLRTGVFHVEAGFLSDFCERYFN